MWEVCLADRYTKFENGQNFPRGGTSPIKTFFKSKQGVIVNIDLAQIEWRIAAELSRDPVMLHELNEGLDIHSDNALRFFGADKYPRDSAEFKRLRTTAKQCRSVFCTVVQPLDSIEINGCLTTV